MRHILQKTLVNNMDPTAAREERWLRANRKRHPGGVTAVVENTQHYGTGPRIKTHHRNLIYKCYDISCLYDEHINVFDYPCEGLFMYWNVFLPISLPKQRLFTGKMCVFQCMYILVAGFNPSEKY